MKIISVILYDNEDTVCFVSTYSPFALRKFFRIAMLEVLWEREDVRAVIKGAKEALKREGEIIKLYDKKQRYDYDIKVITADTFQFCNQSCQMLVDLGSNRG